MNNDDARHRYEAGGRHVTSRGSCSAAVSFSRKQADAFSGTGRSRWFGAGDFSPSLNSERAINETEEKKKNRSPRRRSDVSVESVLKDL